MDNSQVPYKCVNCHETSLQQENDIDKHCPNCGRDGKYLEKAG